MAAGYKWRPIEDLPSGWQDLSSGELDALLQVWKEQRAQMEASGVLGSFNERLQRRWAIETGILERRAPGLHRCARAGGLRQSRAGRRSVRPQRAGVLYRVAQHARRNHGPGSIEEVIISAREILRQKRAVSKEHLERVNPLADALHREAGRRIGEIARKIRTELSRVPALNPIIGTSAGMPEQAVRAAAEALGYDPQAFAPRATAAMRIYNPGNTTAGIVFVQIGRRFHGIIGAIALMASGSWAEPAGDLFQFNYRDDPQALLERFRKWLEPALTDALGKWRERIG